MKSYDTDLDKNISKLKKDKDNKKDLSSKVHNIIHDLPKSDNSDNNQISEDSKSISDYSTVTEALDSQNIELRNEYIKAVKKDIESRSRVRKRILTFYIWYIIIVTLLVFFILIDPVSLLSENKKPFFPLGLKYTLCGAFFVNLISLILAFTRYSLAPIDNIMNEFKDLYRNHNIDSN